MLTWGDGEAASSVTASVSSSSTLSPGVLIRVLAARARNPKITKPKKRSSVRLSHINMGSAGLIWRQHSCVAPGFLLSCSGFLNTYLASPSCFKPCFNFSHQTWIPGRQEDKEQKICSPFWGYPLLLLTFQWLKLSSKDMYRCKGGREMANGVFALGSHVPSVSDTEEEGENGYWGTSGGCPHLG